MFSYYLWNIFNIYSNIKCFYFLMGIMPQRCLPRSFSLAYILREVLPDITWERPYSPETIRVCPTSLENTKIPFSYVPQEPPIFVNVNIVWRFFLSEEPFSGEVPGHFVKFFLPLQHHVISVNNVTCLKCVWGRKADERTIKDINLNLVL